MKRMSPYLNFPGTALEAFDFYRSVFGGDFAMVLRFRDFGNGAGADPAEADLIAHISLPVGDTVLMASDVGSARRGRLSTGTNQYIHLEAESADEARRVFEGLSVDGSVEMPLERTAWAELFGAFKDRFGVQWMVDFTGDVQYGAP